MKEILIFSIGLLDLIIVSLFRYIIEGLTQTERERERERERDLKETPVFASMVQLLQLLVHEILGR